MNLPSDLQRLAPFIAVAVLAMAGLVVVTRGMGGGGSGGDANASVVAQKAFSENPKTAVVSLKAVVTVEGPQRSRTFTFAAAGPVEEVGPGKVDKADLRIDESAGGRKASLRTLSTGDRGFVSVDGRWYELSDPQFKALFEGQGAGGTFVSDLGFNVAQWVKNPRIVDTTRIDGVEVQVLSGELDAAAMAADFGRLGLGAADSFLPEAQTGGQVKVFVGKSDGLVRKIEVTSAYKGKGKAASATVRFDVALTDVGKPQKVEAPKSALPSSRIRGIDRKALGSSAAALRAGGTGSTKANSKTTTEPRPKSSRRSGQAYISCVEQAQNGAALDQCQALVP